MATIIITLTKDDLRRDSKDKALDQLYFEDFYLTPQEINKASHIQYETQNQLLILKSRKQIRIA